MVQLTLRIMTIKTCFKLYIKLVHEILALTSVHSGFYICFCSELSFKPIHYYTALTVIKEGKLITLRLLIALTHWGARSATRWTTGGNHVVSVRTTGGQLRLAATPLFRTAEP